MEVGVRVAIYSLFEFQGTPNLLGHIWIEGGQVEHDAKPDSTVAGMAEFYKLQYVPEIAQEETPNEDSLRRWAGRVHGSYVWAEVEE